MQKVLQPKSKIVNIFLVVSIIYFAIPIMFLFVSSTKPPQDFANFNLINTPWSVILPSLVNPLGTFIIAYYAKENLPKELIQAARLDRASEIRIFLQLSIPILRPALATVFLLNLVTNWNNFYLPLLMFNDSKLFPLSVGLGTSYGGPGLIMGAFVAMAPILVAFLFLQRFWLKNITAGSGV